MQLRLAALISVLCGPFAAAQDMDMSPVKQLQRFAPLIGVWEGGGVSTSGRDGPEMAWSARASVGWILGGHFVREHLRIEQEIRNSIRL